MDLFIPDMYQKSIYTINYKKLKKDLISDGIDFKTNSDTEVIGYMFIKFGPSFVEKINGESTK